MNDIWFTSDQHFFHKRIIEFANRPFSSVEEMNETLVENHNKVVKPTDKVYMLGDFSFGGSHETSIIAKRLNGHITFILGNHDDEKNLRCMNVFSSIHDYLELKKITRSPIALFHFPIDAWNAKHYKAFHLQGHSHGTCDNTGLRRFDVGVDCWNMTPVNWESIEALAPSRDEEARRILEGTLEVDTKALLAKKYWMVPPRAE